MKPSFFPPADTKIPFGDLVGKYQIVLSAPPLPCGQPHAASHLPPNCRHRITLRGEEKRRSGSKTSLDSLPVYAYTITTQTNASRLAGIRSLAIRSSPLIRHVSDGRRWASARLAPVALRLRAGNSRTGRFACRARTLLQNSLSLATLLHRLGREFSALRPPVACIIDEFCN